jgi:hypothetical protein
MQINLRRLPGPKIEDLNSDDEIDLLALIDQRKPPANPHDLLAKLSPDLPLELVEELLAVSGRGLEAVRAEAIEAGHEVDAGGRKMPAMAWRVLAWLLAAERVLARWNPQELRTLISLSRAGSEEQPSPS